MLIVCVHRNHSRRRQGSPDGNMQGTDVEKIQNLTRGTDLKFSTRFSGRVNPLVGLNTSNGRPSAHITSSSFFIIQSIAHAI